MIMSGFVWKTTFPSINEDIILKFVSYCHDILRVKSTTIKLYLCAIRFHYIVHDTDNLFTSDTKLIRVETMLKGIRKSEHATVQKRLPLTNNIIKDIVTLLRKGFFKSNIDQLMEAACVIAFVGFLRCGEFTALDTFCPESNICCEDIVFFENRAVLRLRASKTDIFRRGVDINLFQTNSDICPVASLKRYIQSRTPLQRQEPFFIMDKNQALTRSFFLKSLKSLLYALGFNADLFNGHSFRIGAATSAAGKVEDHMIQTLGRWSSLCYTRYIHTSLANIKKAQIDMQ
ncbi:hypothetical protein SNE40_013349 [Patella caerulea]|uniref:Tyr recombinase domain-containing protein n=1 Tax=Patella caerulea TaxID=87958 RepID=A0AAN8JM32_PATCE